MADRRPKQGENALTKNDRVLYKEIESGVFALAHAGAAMVGTDLVSISNPLPVTALATASEALTPTHTFVNVTIASSLVLAQNTNRKYALFVNDSDTAIYLFLGGAAAVNRGIRINASGGSYEISARNLFLDGIYAIHGGTGNKGLLITEGV